LFLGSLTGCLSSDFHPMLTSEKSVGGINDLMNDVALCMLGREIIDEWFDAHLSLFIETAALRMPPRVYNNLNLYIDTYYINLYCCNVRVKSELPIWRKGPMDTYEIFRNLPEGPIWVESVTGLNKKPERLEILSEKTHGEYFAYDIRVKASCQKCSGNRISGSKGNETAKHCSQGE
jgi:hypothetical protein